MSSLLKKKFEEFAFFLAKLQIICPKCTKLKPNFEGKKNVTKESREKE